MSCNGCRVLRKGCEDDCVLRPSLTWISSSKSQANATLFLAKFYGRAGLLNLLNAGPDHLRPDIFRSLLHEACGRIINPIYGSVGLIWSGNWEQCQSAVDSVLQGSPIKQLISDDNNHEEIYTLPFESCDIRHLSKDVTSKNTNNRPQIRGRFKKNSTDDGPSHELLYVEAKLLEQVDRVVNDGYDNDDDNHEKKVQCLELTLG